MSIEELKGATWVLNNNNGLIFIVNPLMTLSPNFVTYTPTLEEIVAGCKLAPTVPVPALGNEDEGTDFPYTGEGDDRHLIPVVDGVTMGATTLVETLHPVAENHTPSQREIDIKAAVLSIPVEQYGRPAGGRPSMPKIGDVKAITGFDVTTAEIMAAMPAVITEGE